MVIRNALERHSPGAAKILTEALIHHPTLRLVVTTRTVTDLEKLARLALDIEVLDPEALSVTDAEIVDAAREPWSGRWGPTTPRALREQVAGWPVLVGASLEACDARRVRPAGRQRGQPRESSRASSSARR